MLHELRATLRLAAPIIAGLASHGLMMTADTLILGRAEGPALAAAGFSGSLMLLPLVFGYGLLVGAPILAAQGRGAGDGDAGPASRRSALSLALAYGFAAGALIHLAVAFGVLRWLGQPEDVAEVARPFAIFMGWTILPGLLFQALKNAAEADGRPWTPLVWLVAGLLLNALFAYAFVLGKFGAPELGIGGAGLATLLARVVMLAGLARSERARIRAALSRGVSGNLRRTFRFGLPSAMHWLAECGVFTAAPLFLGWKFGHAHLAAHQITITVASLAFMIPLGLSQAAGIRVGEAHGARDRARVRLIGRGALALSAGFMAIYACLLVAARGPVVTAFHATPDVAPLARELLLIAAAFAIVDGIQTVCAGLLRGVGDTDAPFAIAMVAYWVVGLPVGVLLAYTIWPGASGVWAGLAGGLFVAAIGLSLRWRNKTRG